MTELQYKVTIAMGEKHLEPVRYWISPDGEGYYVESEFGLFGPVYNRELAESIQHVLATGDK